MLPSGSSGDGAIGVFSSDVVAMSRCLLPPCGGCLPSRGQQKARSMLLRAALRVCGARGDRQRPIVPQGCPCSIVGAGGLNDRVRDGNGCVPSAVVTSLPARPDTEIAHANAGTYLQER